MIADAQLRVTTIGNLRLLSVIDRHYSNLCLGMKSVEDPGDRPDFDTNTASTADVAFLASGSPVRFMTANGETLICNGWDSNKILSGTSIRDCGSDAASAPAVAAGGSTGLTGTYSALYTYYDSATGFETSPATTAPTAIALTNQSLAVSVTASSNSRFDKIRIYRNANAVPATYRYDQEVSNATATIQSTQADSTLGAEVSYSNYKPPPCKYVAKTATRIFWAGTRPYDQGTAAVVQGSATVTLTEAAPPNMYTRNAEAPFYFQISNGPRYGVTAISGSTITLAVAYKEASNSAATFQILGSETTVYYSDLTDIGLVATESWQTSNRFVMGVPGDVGSRDLQDGITGMIDYGNRLYVFMRESVWCIDPLINQRKRTLAVTGTPSDRTFQLNKDGYLLYLGTDMQVYAFDTNSCKILSSEVRNRFADKDRYNYNLMEFAFAYYDEREGFYVLCRPSASATLEAMRYVVDVWDEYSGKWMEKIPPRITASCKVRDKYGVYHLGIDTLGLVQIINDYDTSVTFVDDAFPSSTPTIFTSVAGEISPNANKKGKVATVFTSALVKGCKFIIGTDTTSVPTENLTDSVTVAAGDNYMIGGWYGIYETGWMDFGEPETTKIFFFIEGTFIKNSAGFLYVSWFNNESATAIDTIRITAGSERKFKRNIPCRGSQIKLKFEAVSELYGLGLRDLNISYKTAAGV